MRTLNIVGAGRVGRACGHLWAKAGVFEIQDVLTRSLESARAAVRFIGAGRAVGALDEMRVADVWMIATPDDMIAGACRALAGSGKLTPDDVVFHVSGATPASELRLARELGALTASVHPIKTFAEAESAVQTFEWTYCSAEGDHQALRVLKSAFERIGARLFDIAPELKGVYHAGGVFACNYLAALIEAALRCHEKAGIPRADSLKALEPMVRETVDAIFDRGPARALSGPISRGDTATVRRQLAMVENWDHDIAGLYRNLGLLTVALAESNDRLDTVRAAELRRVLSSAADQKQENRK
jgi:predicted short-subunit dehydrogenase-like oxidoreductase (DUF2520 family)